MYLASTWNREKFHVTFYYHMIFIEFKYWHYWWGVKQVLQIGIYDMKICNIKIESAEIIEKTMPAAVMASTWGFSFYGGPTRCGIEFFYRLRIVRIPPD